jgi:hypothetical protein
MSFNRESGGSAGLSISSSFVSQLSSVVGGGLSSNTVTGGEKSHTKVKPALKLRLNGTLNALDASPDNEHAIVAGREGR